MVFWWSPLPCLPSPPFMLSRSTSAAGCPPSTSGSTLTGLSAYPSAEKHAHRFLSPFTSTLCLLSGLTSVWEWALTTVMDQKEIRLSDFEMKRRKDFSCLDESGPWVSFCQVTFILNADLQTEQRETEGVKKHTVEINGNNNLTENKAGVVVRKRRVAAEWIHKQLH